jgi:hypothetical protein
MNHGCVSGVPTFFGASASALPVSFANMLYVNCHKHKTLIGVDVRVLPLVFSLRALFSEISEGSLGLRPVSRIT